MKRENMIVLCVSVIGLGLRLYMAQIDPFIHEWDEHFHALVARNMMDNPLVPMLRKIHFSAFNYISWTSNQVWLHKQPLFLWQMALSLKVFGISEFTLRLPSVLMGTLMIPMLYRVTMLFTNHFYTSLIAAILMCFSYYQLELTAGQKGMEHNDIAFGFYILASIWAYFEFLNSNQRKWVFFAGLFVGLAILNKWIVGVIVFSGWGLNALLDSIKNKKINSFWQTASAFFICVLVALPWQIYAYMNFPLEYIYEINYNTQHIRNAIEGHEGDNGFL